MKKRIAKVIGCCLSLSLSPILGGDGDGYLYSTERYAFTPRKLEPHENGLEYYVADTTGGEYTGRDGSVPVFYCKFGNMIAVNVVGVGKPWLWKTGNVVVALTGDEGDSPHKAHSESLIVVMDSDNGELSVARPSPADMKFMIGMRRVVVKGHVVFCYDEVGNCHEIPVSVKHKNSVLSRLQSRRMIADAAERGCSNARCGKKWVDPKTGLEWAYVETDDGVEVVNRWTGGCAVSPMPADTLVFPEYINGRPVKSIGSGAIVNCMIKTVRIPKTLVRFQDKAPRCLFNNMLQSVEVEDGNAMFRGIGGLLYDSTGTVLLFVPCGLTEAIIPNGVVKIDDRAFGYCHSLKTISIPPSVRELGKRVFFMSLNLTTVRFQGDAPDVPTAKYEGIYLDTPTMLKTIVPKNMAGWQVNGEFPTLWCDRQILFE